MIERDVIERDVIERDVIERDVIERDVIERDAGKRGGVLEVARPSVEFAVWFWNGIRPWDGPAHQLTKSDDVVQ